MRECWVERVTPTKSAQQNINGHFYQSSNSPTTSDTNFSPPELLIYDVFGKKTAQELLYEVYMKSLLLYNLIEKCFFHG
jgi:K+-transporting ATPase A subunit